MRWSLTRGVFISRVVWYMQFNKRFSLTGGYVSQRRDHCIHLAYSYILKCVCMDKEQHDNVL